MKEGFLAVLALSLLFVPALLCSADDVDKDSGDKQILETKPDKKICDEYISVANQLMKDFKYEKTKAGFILHCPDKDLNKDEINQYEFKLSK